MRSLHTPQTETNSAYNPGVSYRGGEFIAQGISQAGNAISAGLAQFAKNREERDYMDERMKSVAANLAKYRDFEKSASEDDTSPAGTLLKTFSNWDNKPLAAKKAALVDADHLITKSERNLDQARAEQYQLLAVQDRQAQFAEQKKQNQIAEERNWKNDALDALYRHQAAMRGIEADRRAEDEFGLRKQIYADTRARYAASAAERAAMDQRLANFSQLAAQPTGPSRMGGDLAASLFSQPGTGLPDFSAYGPQDTQLTQQPISTARIAQLGAQTGAWQHPQFDNLAKLYQGEKLDPISQLNADAAMLNAKTHAAEAARRATGGNPAGAMPAARDNYAPFPDPKGGWTWKPIKPVDGASADPETAGRIAQLEHLLQQGGGKDFAFDFDKSQGYSTSRMMHTGESAKAELARLKGQRGGGAPGASPAASKVVTTKEQFDALPSGATYEGKDGRTYRKP